MANIEDIIEINDLASLSIEAGDYHAALDVLNRCLACIKQLKNSDESDNNSCKENGDNSGDDKIPPKGRQQQGVSISEVLKAAKEKLMWRRSGTASAADNGTATATVTASETTSSSNKRKLSPAPSSVTAARKTARAGGEGGGPALRSRRKRRRCCGGHSGDCNDNREAAELVIVAADDVDEKTQQPQQPQQNGTVNTSAAAITASNVVDDDSESGYFIYRKPLRLTESQLKRIVEYRRLRRKSRNATAANCDHDDDDDDDDDTNTNNNSESRQRQKQRLVQIQREIELAVSSNLVFNIALSHHLIAAETDVDGGGGDSERLQRDKEHRLKGALRLYELGFRVHAKRAAAFTSSSSSSSSSSSAQRRQQDLYEDEELRSATRYALALINNCAEIHDSLGSTRKADAFRRKLLSFLLMMVDGGESMSAIVSDSDALDGYLRNVFDPILFGGGESAPAAAA